VSTIFIGCFSFGLLFTIATFLLGAFGNDLHFHGSVHGLLGGSAGHGAHGSHGGGQHVSPFSMSTISAFLAWFGGAGYLLSTYSPLTAFTITLAATAFGLLGGAVVFLVIGRVIMPRLTVMSAEDFRVQGAIARVTSVIQAGGIGEIVYTLGGTRHADGARSVSGESIERDTQVLILRLEKGIAVVEPLSNHIQ